jgi:hypothetical protein
MSGLDEQEVDLRNCCPNCDNIILTWRFRDKKKTKIGWIDTGASTYTDGRLVILEDYQLKDVYKIECATCFEDVKVESVIGRSIMKAGLKKRKQERLRWVS